MSIHVSDETSCSGTGTVGGIHWPLFERCAARGRPCAAHAHRGTCMALTAGVRRGCRRSQEAVGANNRQ